VLAFATYGQHASNARNIVMAERKALENQIHQFQVRGRLEDRLI